MAHGGGATMGGKIWSIILVIIIIGVVAYFWNSGLVNKGANGLMSLFPPLTTTSTAFTSTPPGFNAVNGPALPQTTIGPSGPTSTIGPANNPSQIPAGFTAAQISPYFHEIGIGTIFPGAGSSYGEITIISYLNPNENVDVTGWKLQAHHGSEFIPQAVELYQPSGFATAGDIRLSSGQTLYLYTSSGPINLRLNECSGYLQNNLNTNPALPLNCPYVNQSQVATLSGACQNYINSIPACTVPDTYNPRISSNDYNCQQFLSTMNYNGCFKAHLGDANFLSNQWWAWTGNNILDPFHDVVQLYDRSGLLVDERTY
jgi:hypothetical protein